MSASSVDLHVVVARRRGGGKRDAGFEDRRRQKRHGALVLEIEAIPLFQAQQGFAEGLVGAFPVIGEIGRVDDRLQADLLPLTQLVAGDLARSAAMSAR